MKLRKILLTIAITLTTLIIMSSMAFATDAKVDNNTYTHPSRFDNCLVIDGIDVSYWQKDYTDWKKVKQSGIDFAMIRIGYTGEASPFSTNFDSYFEENYAEAKAAGVQVGVYYYAQPTSVGEAKKEAEYVLKLLDGRSLDLPVAFDIEVPSSSRVTAKYKNYSTSARRANMTTNALTFLKTIEQESNGKYEAMFYSYRGIMDNYNGTRKFDMNLIDNKYKVWIAQYYTDISYASPFNIWQYSSSGSVDGIQGRTDCNFWYYDNENEETKDGTKSIKDTAVSLGTSAFTYSGVAKTPIVTVSDGGSTLTKGIDYKVNYIKNVFSGTAYAMVTGIGKYSNTAMKSFSIAPRKMSSCTMNAIPDVVYSGSAKKPSVTVKYNGSTLFKDRYAVKYSSNTNAGTATVTVTGTRNYSGTISKTFKITQKAGAITSSSSTYNKTTNDEYFLLNAKANSKATLRYKSSDTSIATVTNTGRVNLTGNPGTAEIIINCPSTSNYTAGSKTVAVNVVKEADRKIATINTDTMISKPFDSDPFTIKYATNSDGAASFKSSSTSIASVSKTGKVTIFKAGTVKITISTAQTNNYTAASKVITCTFTNDNTSTEAPLIAGVKATTIKISSFAGVGSVKLVWKKAPAYRVDGYQVYRSASTTSNFTKISTYKKQTSCLNTKNITAGTKYYYKVRGYRTIGGETVYTKWSMTVSRTPKSSGDLSSQEIKDLIAGVENTTLNAKSEAGIGYIRVSWTKAPEFKVDYFEIFRSEKENTGYSTTPFFKTTDGTWRSYKNTKSVESGTRYYYKVRGVRNVGDVTVYTPWSTIAYRVAK